jgi:hypothetical protein
MWPYKKSPHNVSLRKTPRNTDIKGASPLRSVPSVDSESDFSLSGKFGDTDTIAESFTESHASLALLDEPDHIIAGDRHNRPIKTSVDDCLMSPPRELKLNCSATFEYDPIFKKDEEIQGSPGGKNTDANSTQLESKLVTDKFLKPTKEYTAIMSSRRPILIFLYIFLLVISPLVFRYAMCAYKVSDKPANRLGFVNDGIVGTISWYHGLAVIDWMVIVVLLLDTFNVFMRFLPVSVDNHWPSGDSLLSL